MSAVAMPPAPATAAEAEVTPEDLLRMGSEGKGYELVDGRLEELNLSFLSSYVAGKTYKLIDRHVEAGNLGWVVPESTSFQCFPDARKKVRRPDVAFLALTRLTPTQARAEGHCTVVPDLVVEVISPNDFAKLINRKVEEWLGAGVKLVWVIDPEAKLVHCHQPAAAATRRELDTLTGDPVLPGFAIPVADLFRLPAPPPPPG